LKIKILNWEKYNPRKDIKKITWLRLESDVAFSQSLFNLSVEEKWFWIFLLSMSAKKGLSCFKLDISYAEFHSGVKKSQILVALKKFHEKQLVTIDTNGSERIRTETCSTNETNGTNGTHKRTRTYGKEQEKEIMDYFNTTCKKYVPRGLKLTQSRKELIKKRLKEFSLEEIKTAITNFSKDTWEDRKKYCDLVYAIGTKNKIDNLDKWLNSGFSNSENKYVRPPKEFAPIVPGDK